MKRRRRKLKTKRIFLLLVVIISLVVLTNQIDKINFKESINEETTKKEDTQEKSTYTANLIMVGDALVHDRLYNDAKKQANNDGYDFKPYLKLIKEKVVDYDIAYYNQETILGGTSIGLSSYPSFNSPQELGDAMIDAGFNLVSLATNHTLDRGKNAVLLSREYWNKQAGVHAVGSYSSLEEKTAIESTILEVNNITYAMLNYTYGTNGIRIPDGSSYLVNLWNVENNYEGYKQNVKSDIENLRDKVDVLIVAMHWGVEYTRTPTNLQKEMAEYLASLDVDIIIGTHSHVIEPVEWIDDTIVFYSLGNFISAQTSSSCSDYKCNIGLMSSLTITKTELDNEINITIENIQNELIYTYHSNYENYLVIPFSNNKIKEYLPNYETIYDKYAKIITSTDERIKTVPLST